MKKIERVFFVGVIIALTINNIFIHKKLKLTEKLAIELINDVDSRDKKIDKLITELIELNKQ